MKAQSSKIENKYLRIKTINIGACLYEVYDKQIQNLGLKIRFINLMVTKEEILYMEEK